MPKQYRFIVADDDENDRLLIEHVLLRQYRTALINCFADGETAFRHFQIFGADAVITDFQMPKMTGADLSRAVRMIGGSVPIVVVSGNSDSREKALQAEASGFLEKSDLHRLPVIVQVLLNEVLSQ